MIRTLELSLKERQKEGLLREEKQLPLGVEDFSSNDYFGMAQDPDVKGAATEALMKYGTSNCSSKYIAGYSEIHAALEDKLAQYYGMGASCLFGAGYLANIGAVSALASKDDLVVMDKFCHSSLYSAVAGVRAKVARYPHQNFSHLEKIIKENPVNGKIFILTESIFSMDGDIEDLQALINIAKKYSAFVIIDDAHGIGVLEPILLKYDLLIITGTLSKALGSFGGYVAADKTIINYIKNFAASQIYATSLPTHLCAAAASALDKILSNGEKLRQNLRSRILRFRKAIPNINLKIPIIPYIIGDPKQAINTSEFLLESGFYIPAIRTPTVPEGTDRLRITLSLRNSMEKVEELVSKIIDL